MLRIMRDTRPRALRWRAHNREDPQELVLIRSTGEEGTPDRSNIDAGVIDPPPGRDIGGSIPERNNFVREDKDLNPKARARSKSASLSWPSLLIRRFSSLRSRCMTILEWQNSIPRSN